MGSSIRPGKRSKRELLLLLSQGIEMGWRSSQVKGVKLEREWGNLVRRRNSLRGRRTKRKTWIKLISADLKSF